MSDAQRRYSALVTDEESIELIPLNRSSRAPGVREASWGGKKAPSWSTNWPANLSAKWADLSRGGPPGSRGQQCLQSASGRVVIGAAAATTCLALAYVLLDISFHVEFHRPCPTFNASLGSHNFTRPEQLPGETPWNEDAATWQGYEHYLARLHQLSPLPPTQPRQHKVTGWGPFGYAQFSAYRTGLDQISSIGFGAVQLRGTLQVSKCAWQGSHNASLAGRVEVKYANVQGDLLYDVIILQCLFSVPTGSMGGTAVVTIGSEDVVIYSEAQGQWHPVEAPANTKFLRQLTVCTPPVSTPVEARVIAEFMEYQRRLGADHIVMYDGGAFSAVLADVSKQYLEQGQLEVVPFRDPQRFNLSHGGHFLALHDCLYRSRFSSKWVLVADWDEFLFVPPPGTLSSILSQHEGAAWLTHGTYMWSPTRCRPGPPAFGSDKWQLHSPDPGPFLIERLVFRWPKVLCHNTDKEEAAMCLDVNGGRKYIVDPRKVAIAHFFKVAEPAEGGINLPFDVMHQQKYEGIHLLPAFFRVCSELVLDEASPEWWVRDSQQADFCRQLRSGSRPEHGDKAH